MLVRLNVPVMGHSEHGIFWGTMEVVKFKCTHPIFLAQTCLCEAVRVAFFVVLFVEVPVVVLGESARYGSLDGESFRV